MCKANHAQPFSQSPSLPPDPVYHVVKHIRYQSSYTSLLVDGSSLSFWLSLYTDKSIHISISNIGVKMTMKDSEGAKEMEELTDTMIISLMQEMKALALSNKKVDSQSSADATGEPSALDEMKNVLTLYQGIIEQLWKIAENIAKTSAVEERHAGTVFMGSSGDGTYVPELSSEFDTYVMEEDSQYELQEDLEAMDADFAEKNPQDRSHMLKVCC